MYKCNNCGQVFDEAKTVTETHGFAHGPFEKLCVCPCCNGDYSESKQCKQCGEWHFEDELFDGYCTDCLRDEIDYITAYDYMRSIKDCLNIFIFEKCLDSSVPQKTNKKVDLLSARLYWEAVNTEQYSNGDMLMRKLRSYIIEEDGDFGKSNFAEWLNGREV